MMGINARMHDLLAEHGTKLLRQVAGVRDGDPDSIHDARVATRRIREILSILGSDHDQAHQAFHEQMRLLGRALGNARDQDVIADLLAGKGAHRSGGAKAVTAFKDLLRREREDARRDAIKAIEGVPLAALVPSERERFRGGRRRSGDLSARLREQMRLRSRELGDAMGRASGVYFPNRTHQVRVCAKRLRYVVELAAHAGRWHSDREVKILTRVQDVLGDIHDREVLIERLREVSGEDRSEIEAVRTRLTHERDDLFKKYLSLRDALSRVTESIREETDTRPWNWSLLAAAVGGLIQGLFPGTAADLVTFLLIVPVVVTVVMLAAYIPARRAARIDPLVALRQD